MRNLFESVIRESIRIANAITVRIWKILLRWRLPIPPWLQLRALSPIGKVKYVLETAEDATRVLSLGTKEPTTLRMIQLVRDGDLVVEVGASMGIYSVCFAKACLPSGTVICIEPDQSKVSRLKRNLALNGVERVALVLAKGASDNYQNNSVPLDSLIPNPFEYRSFYLKIDTDGHELAVLTGMNDCFGDSRRPRLIQLEQRIDDIAVAEFLTVRGYRMVHHDTPSRHDLEVSIGHQPSGISWWVSIKQ
jgi:Met-10+ like-protein